jgi:uncharacterized protein (TIGR03435 family)
VVLSVLLLAGSFAPRWISFAQQQPRPSFEVASVKPGDPDNLRRGIFSEPGGRLSVTNTTLRMLIGFAYDVRDHQISGGGNWLDSAKFNVDAKPPGAVPAGLAGQEQERLMVQSLLAERFHLAIHREMREAQVYELVVEKGGPKFQAAPGGERAGPRGIGMKGEGHLTSYAAPIGMFVVQLSQELGRSVIDKTGLMGKYDFKLDWTPDTPLPADASGPSIFTAIQENLGLKLQSARGPVEILVIDRVEKPDAN